MKIDKQTEEAKQLIKMLNEDLVSAKINLEVPLTLKDVTFSDIETIDNADSGNDDSIKPNTKVKITFPHPENNKPQEIIYEYRRLNLSNIATFNDIDISNKKNQNTILKHNNDVIISDSEFNSKVINSIADTFTLAKNTNITISSESDIKSGTSTFTATTSASSYFFTGNTTYKAITRDTNYGEYIKEDNTHAVFQKDTKLDHINAKVLALPVALTTIPESYITDSNINTLYFNDKVNTISNNAFTNCNIDKLYITNVETINENSFSNATIKNVYVDNLEVAKKLKSSIKEFKDSNFLDKDGEIITVPETPNQPVEIESAGLKYGF